MRKKLFFLTLILLLFSGKIYGQGYEPFLKVYPRTLEKSELNPGSNFDISINLTNTSPETIETTINIEDFYPYQNKKITTTEIKDWTILEVHYLTLLPKETKVIKGKISIPDSTIPGAYYGKVAFIPFINQEPIAAYHQADTIIVLNIAEKKKPVEKALLESFKVLPKETQYGPVQFETVLSNLGNTNLTPEGEIIIRNYQGEEVSRIPFQLYSERVIFPPETTLNFKNKWDEFLLKNPEDAPESWNFLQEFALDWTYWNKFRIGSYSAELNLSYGQDNGKHLYGTTDFFVFPWRFLLYSLCLIILILIFTFELLSWYQKKLRKRLVSEFQKNFRLNKY